MRMVARVSATGADFTADCRATPLATVALIDAQQATLIAPVTACAA